MCKTNNLEVMVKPTNRPKVDPLRYGIRGINLLGEEKFEKALECFEKALALRSDDPNFLLNKLTALVSLLRYEEAISLARFIVETYPFETCTFSAYNHLGTIYYCIQHYEEALECCKTTMTFPGNEAKRNADKCKRRIRESQGLYDFVTLKDIQTLPGDIDCSEYIGPIKIRDEPSKTASGRNQQRLGLECTKDVGAGTLLFSVVTLFTHPLSTPGITEASVTKQEMDIIQESMQHYFTTCDMHCKRQLHALYSTMGAMQRNVELDDFRYHKVVTSNIKPYNREKSNPDLYNLPILEREQIAHIAKYAGRTIPCQGWGIWSLAAMANHSCIPNACCFQIKGFLFVFASGNLKAGQEIFLERGNYRSMSYPKRIERLGFKCECPLCLLDAQETEKSFKTRIDCIDTFKYYCGQPQQSHERYISKLEESIKSIKKTYSDQDRILQTELETSLRTLGLVYGDYNLYKKGIIIYLQLITTFGFSGKLSFTKTKLPQYPPIHFKIQLQGNLLFEHTYLFMELSRLAKILGYQTLFRQSLAISRLAAFIHQGFIPKEHAFYELALACFEKALLLSPDHEGLLFNKLTSLGSLFRYEEVLELGAHLTIVKQSTEIKVYQTLAIAYYNIEAYEKSIECNQMVLGFQPNNAEAKINIGRCVERIPERDHGRYNFDKIKANIIKTGRLDCSEYIGPIKIRDEPSKTESGVNQQRIGLEVTKDVAAGTILFATTACRIQKELPVSWGEHETEWCWGLWSLASLANHSCLYNTGTFHLEEILFAVASKNLKAGDEIFISRGDYTSLAYPKRIEELGFKCECPLCLLDAQESPNSFRDRKILLDLYRKNYQIQVATSSSRGQYTAKLQDLVKKLKNTYSDSDRHFQFEIEAPLSTLASTFNGEKAIVPCLQLITMSGFTGKLSFTKEKLPPQDPPIHFKIENEGFLRIDHIGLFMNLCKESKDLGYETLSRQALAISRHAAFIHMGLSLQEHAAYFKTMGYPNQYLTFRDTVDAVESRVEFHPVVYNFHLFK
ncbi:hypothetical protein DFA_07507 [Cavenderia fasciculata]|uniref:SET domain-containing protein n=1 Tax=Cavenderia fasciculata TaxID=261658 RepID=F4PWL9_CACFS|nr:uncharacterized protein DFA_07507 [Cavenderia fasciculata]EGG20383.1 hypothetical protein DFA_07507 [Cavenderia fasciculata]|eukprot:XP_004367366.1 hypothetical protein DFA_07507 [Cavenderia fasciculata]